MTLVDITLRMEHSSRPAIGDEGCCKYISVAARAAYSAGRLTAHDSVGVDSFSADLSCEQPVRQSRLRGCVRIMVAEDRGSSLH